MPPPNLVAEEPNPPGLAVPDCSLGHDIAHGAVGIAHRRLLDHEPTAHLRFPAVP